MAKDRPAGGGEKDVREGAHAQAHAHDDDHDHEHDHDHDHDHEGHHGGGGHHAHGADELRGVPERKLRLALALTLTYMFVEIAAGLYSHSLTLTSDAGHMFVDAGSLLLALIAQRFAARKATQERTYGFRRAETLAAFFNGLVLTGTAAVVLHEAWERWKHPAHVLGAVVVAVASVGLMVNLTTAWILSRGTAHNLNTRAALAHVAFDAIGAFVAIVAGLSAWVFGLNRLDPVLSVVMAGLILWGAWLILKRAMWILMEGTPAGLDVIELEKTIRATPGVAGLHDLHAWTISEGFDAVTVHVVLDGTRHGTDVARDVGERIHVTHRMAHVTVQPEAPESVLRPVQSLLHRPN